MRSIQKSGSRFRLGGSGCPLSAPSPLFSCFERPKPRVIWFLSGATDFCVFDLWVGGCFSIVGVNEEGSEHTCE
jgi:hypothetical protein